jgi:hypothetical protein
MENHKIKAWELLTTKEKNSLQLVFGHGKSNMEASVIMNIFPYKFTEILLRAKKFFLVFSEHFYVWDNLDLEGCDNEFRAYIESTVLHRKTVPKAIEAVNSSKFYDYNYRINLLSEEMGLLLQDTPTTYDLLITFDQWNAFRILPKQFQVPSPFNRRQNKAFKRIYEKITNLSELSYRAIDKAFYTKHPPMMHVPLLGEYHGNQIMILPVPKSEKNIKYFSKNLLPVFISRDKALEFAKFVHDYYSIPNKTIHLSRLFWPGFRKLVNEADNLNLLLNLKDFNSSLSEIISNKDIKHLYSISEKSK